MVPERELAAGSACSDPGTLELRILSELNSRSFEIDVLAWDRVHKVWKGKIVSTVNGRLAQGFSTRKERE